MKELLVSWWRARAVASATAVVVVALIAGIALAGWRLQADADASAARHAAARPEGPADGAIGCVVPDGTVPCRVPTTVGDRSAEGRGDDGGVGLAPTHAPAPAAAVSAADIGRGRHLVVAPLMALAVLAAALGAAVASSDALAGVVGLVVATSSGWRAGVATHALAAAAASVAWFASMAVLVVGGVVALVATVGQGPVVDLGAVAEAVPIAGRLALAVLVLAALGHALAVAAPGSSLPVLAVVLGPVAVELLVLVATSGDVALAPGGSWLVVARAGGAAAATGLDGSVATWAAAGLPAAVGAAALATYLVAHRRARLS